MAATPVVDSHHHFWNLAWRPYPWMDGLAPLHRAFEPDDLRPLLREEGVDYTILVQTVSDVQETREFLHIAGETDFVAGVIGWVDLNDPDVDVAIRALKDRPDGTYLVGIRHQVHDEADPDYLLRGGVQNGIKRVGAAGLVYDLLLRPPYINAAVSCAASLPEMRFVVDHIGKPEIARGGFAEWSRKMAPFAEMPHVACKLSGLVTEANWTSWMVEELKPYVHRVMEIFGEDRVLFGSDWPVCTLAASYQQVIEAARATLGPLDAATDAKIFGGNALRWYRLPIG